jgi:hypothetical protein
MKKFLFAGLSFLMLAGCSDTEVKEVKGEKQPEPKQEQPKKDLLENPEYKDIKQDENGKLVDIYELTPESKLARVKEFKTVYYDQAKYNEKVKDFEVAVFSIVTSTASPEVDPDTLEETGNKTGELTLNMAVRNNGNHPYTIYINKVITNVGKQYEQPTFWINSDPSQNNMFPDEKIHPGVTSRWDITYNMSPEDVEKLEWIQIDYTIFGKEDMHVKDVTSPKIKLGEPTKFE